MEVDTQMLGLNLKENKLLESASPQEINNTKSCKTETTVILISVTFILLLIACLYNYEKFEGTQPRNAIAWLLLLLFIFKFPINTCTYIIFLMGTCRIRQIYMQSRRPYWRREIEINLFQNSTRMFVLALLITCTIGTLYGSFVNILSIFYWARHNPVDALISASILLVLLFFIFSIIIERLNMLEAAFASLGVGIVDLLFWGYLTAAHDYGKSLVGIAITSWVVFPILLLAFIGWYKVRHRKVSTVIKDTRNIINKKVIAISGVCLIFMFVLLVYILFFIGLHY